MDSEFRSVSESEWSYGYGASYHPPTGINIPHSRLNFTQRSILQARVVHRLNPTTPAGAPCRRSSSTSTHGMCSLCYKKHHGSKETCYKKVGLAARFPVRLCRCGKMLCRRHRYAEEHGRAFDFKGAARDVIARANPRIKGEKLLGKI
ncbi:hypothetical protein HU200_000849 [Digitaria exilis]|uniref:AN1-type domain-containing protein n=1 Tax=Digitaria exilis TaxID=1010633 RepID=A0A835G0T9_9POAL|nr:hypothetical protein HU200_000849 [Digitaria exilis]